MGFGNHGQAAGDVRSPPAPPFDRRELLELGALLLVALVLRGGVLWKFAGRLAEDNDNYRAIAARVVAGDGFADPQSHTPTAYRPPLYPLLLAGVLTCGGGDLSIGIVQLVMGVAAAGLTVLCGRRLGFRRAALIAGLLVAADPLLLHQTALVMTETTATLLAVIILWLALAERSGAQGFWLGAALGLACLCRPTFWAFAVLAAAGSIFAPMRRGALRGCPARGWQAALPAAAGLMLVVAPWGIRNVFVFGRPIVTTTHGGYTLLLAHNPEYTRRVVDQPWGAVWDGDLLAGWQASLEREMAREEPPIDVARLSPAVELARDKWMSRKAWDYIGRQQVTALRAGLTLVTRFWNVVPMEVGQRPLLPAIRLAIGVYYTGVLLAMLAGIIRLQRRDWSRWWPAIALIAAFTAVHALYWADMRMRAPLVPAIALLAAGCAGRGCPAQVLDGRGPRREGEPVGVIPP